MVVFISFTALSLICIVFPSYFTDFSPSFIAFIPWFGLFLPLSSRFLCPCLVAFSPCSINSTETSIVPWGLSASLKLPAKVSRFIEILLWNILLIVESSMHPKCWKSFFLLWEHKTTCYSHTSNSGQFRCAIQSNLFYIPHLIISVM